MNLYCCSVTGEGGTDTRISSKTFQPDQGKKSSFLLEESFTITQPAHLTIECFSATSFDANIFVLGGFQLVSNAKQVEIYTTDQVGKETYLMTSKGVQSEKGENGEEWKKAVCVVPGGPRPILGLKIKLSSLLPKESNEAMVKSLKLTARYQEVLPAMTQPKTPIVEVSNTGVAPTVPRTGSGLPSSGTVNVPASSGITDADLRAAMGSLSIMARTTESAIESSMTEKFHVFDGIMQQRFTILQQNLIALTSVISSQQKTLEQQTQMLEAQQRMIKTQSEQIESLLSHQNVASEKMNQIQDILLSLQQENDEPPSQASETPPLHEPPIERGIEHTLSNLEQSHLQDDEAEGDQENTSEKSPLESTELKSSYSNSTLADTEIPENTEKIEVSLTGIDQTEVSETMQRTEVETQRPLWQMPLNDPSSVGDGLPNPTRSFEDRNDKSAMTQVDTDACSDNVQLEVLAVDEQQTVEVVQSMTSDEHERSPPDSAPEDDKNAVSQTDTDSTDNNIQWEVMAVDEEEYFRVDDFR